MKIVIQCASKKQPDAGSLAARNGRPVKFVAHPEEVEVSRGCHYARPDDAAYDGKTWREILLDYNANPGANPLRLLPAYRLYKNEIYSDLVEQYGVSNVLILSAGWGVVKSDFLLPIYDITFSAAAEKYKRRRRKDDYNDFSLADGCDDDLLFFGGKDYLPLFAELTSGVNGKRYAFYNSSVKPEYPGCAFIKYETSTRTNWHYSCAKDFLSGRITVDPICHG